MTTSDPAEAEYPHQFMGRPRMCVRCNEHEEGLLVEKFNCPVLMREKLGAIVVDESKLKSVTFAVQPRVQIHVTLLDGSSRFYPVNPEQGWKIDAGSRCLLIGKGYGRIYVPLDNVDCFSPVTY